MLSKVDRMQAQQADNQYLFEDRLQSTTDWLAELFSQGEAAEQQLRTIFDPGIIHRCTQNAMKDLHHFLIEKHVEETLAQKPSLEAQHARFAKHVEATVVETGCIKIAEMKEELTQVVTDKTDEAITLLNQVTKAQTDATTDLITNLATKINSNLHSCLRTQITTKEKSAAQLGEFKLLTDVSKGYSTHAKWWLSGGNLCSHEVEQMVQEKDGSFSTKPVKTQEACALIGNPVFSVNFLASIGNCSHIHTELLNLHVCAQKHISHATNTKIDDCLKADLDKLPSQPTLSEFACWWDMLCNRLPAYGLYLCPLDAWNISRYEEIGFLLPGLSLCWCIDMSRDLSTVLVDLMTKSSKMGSLFIRSKGSGGRCYTIFW